MGDSLTSTHEWRRLDDFRAGDFIHRWGDDLRVESVEPLPDGHIRLIYHDTDGKPKMIDGRKQAEYIALKGK